MPFLNWKKHGKIVRQMTFILIYTNTKFLNLETEIKYINEHDNGRMLYNKW